MKRISSLLLMGVFLCAGLWSARAAEEFGDEMALYMNDYRRLTVSNPTRIAIGNPSVLDVSNPTKSEIVLTPKAPGKTTLVIWDSFGENSYVVNVYAEDMREVKRRVDNVIKELNLPDVFTRASDEEARVILLGEVKTAQDRERVTTALGDLVKKTVDLLRVKEEEAVIEIDVQILELDKDATRTLGVTWPGAISMTEVGSPAIQDIGTKMSTFFKVLNYQRNVFEWQLDFLIKEGKAKVLSRPRLACQSGKEAELLVGGEKPVMTTQVVSGGGATTEVDYKEYGIKLKVKPIVNDERRIKLGLNVEVSEIGDAEILGAADAPTARAYPLIKRNVATELFLSDGQTLAIGGLMKQKKEDDVTRLAGLSEIPVLGLLFRQREVKTGGGSGERGNMELFITLTPKIVSDRRAADKQEQDERVQRYDAGQIDPTVTGPARNYVAAVQQRVMSSMSYPTSAREAGFEGIVKLGLRVSYAGVLLESRISASSGYKTLDDHALAVAQSIPQYPPFPSTLEQKDIWVEVPIVFRLD